VSTVPGSKAKEAANKSYIREHSTSYGSSISMASAKVCSYQSKWQNKEKQIKALQMKAVETQWQPWL
jgi:hypothetical protein